VSEPTLDAAYALAAEYFPGLDRRTFETLATDYLLLRHEWEDIVGPDAEPDQADIERFFLTSNGVLLDLLRSVGAGGCDDSRAGVVLGCLGVEPKPVSVLDLAGGTGSLAIALCRAGYAVHYADLGPVRDFALWRFQHVDAAIRDFDPRWFTQERGTLPRRFDAIVCLDLLEHLQEPIRIIARMAKGVGFHGLLVTTMHGFKAHPGGWPTVADNYHLQEDLPGFLIGLGFVEHRPPDPAWGIGAWMKR
jgi:hypothetical protein